jgi:hypothetical protein
MQSTLVQTAQESTEPTDLELQLIEDSIELDATDQLEADFRDKCQYSHKEARAAARQVQLEDEKFY